MNAGILSKPEQQYTQAILQTRGLFNMVCLITQRMSDLFLYHLTIEISYPPTECDHLALQIYV